MSRIQQLNPPTWLRPGALCVTTAALPVEGARRHTLETNVTVMVLHMLTWSNGFGTMTLLLPNGNVDNFSLFSYELQPVEAPK